MSPTPLLPTTPQTKISPTRQRTRRPRQTSRHHRRPHSERQPPPAALASPSSVATTAPYAPLCQTVAAICHTPAFLSQLPAPPRSTISGSSQSPRATPPRPRLCSSADCPARKSAQSGSHPTALASAPLHCPVVAHTTSSVSLCRYHFHTIQRHAAHLPRPYLSTTGTRPSVQHGTTTRALSPLPRPLSPMPHICSQRAPVPHHLHILRSFYGHVRIPCCYFCRL